MPRRRVLVLVAAAAVVVVVGVALLMDVNGEPRTVDVGPAEPGPGTALERSIPSVLRVTCPTEGSIPTLESRRVALQADGLHIEVAPYRGDQRRILLRGNYDVSHSDLGYTQRTAVSSFVVRAHHLTDLEPSAIELAVACGYSDPFGPDEVYRGFAVEDPDEVWSSSAGGCRGHAIESDTVNVPDDLASDLFARFLRARTPGIRESDAFEPVRPQGAEGGLSVVRGGEPVARWYFSESDSAVLVTCPGSGIGTLG
jgi:hypothetical protein